MLISMLVLLGAGQMEAQGLIGKFKDKCKNKGKDCQ